MGRRRDREENQTESHFPDQNESWERSESRSSSRNREKGTGRSTHRLRQDWKGRWRTVTKVSDISCGNPEVTSLTTWRSQRQTAFLFYLLFPGRGKWTLPCFESSCLFCFILNLSVGCRVKLQEELWNRRLVLKKHMSDRWSCKMLGE